MEKNNLNPYIANDLDDQVRQSSILEKIKRIEICLQEKITDLEHMKQKMMIAVEKRIKNRVEVVLDSRLKEVSKVR